jgi:putative peptidoglycan lipid II flippase
LTGRQLSRATGVIAMAFVFSGILGVVRQAIIGARFGAGGELDAFYAAYRIPEMLFTLIAGGALGSAFIPIFARFLGNDDLQGAWRLASAVITLVALAAIILAVFVGLSAHWVTSRVLIPDASPAQQALTARLMQIMLVTVVIFGISGLMMGILNAYQHFLTPALAPSMNNLGVIVGAVLFAPFWGIYGLAAGAVLGALLHVGIQLPALWTLQPRLRPLPDPAVPGVSEVLKLMGPRMIGSAVVQINFVVNTILASGMVAGSFTALTVAFSLMFTVLGVLGQSVGTAVFPSLVALSVRNDMDGFRQTLSGSVRSILFMAIPASVGIFILATPLVATIYQRGRWMASDTLATAWALQFFAIGLAAFALQEVLARAFYALRDTATPVAIAVGGMLLNVVLSLILIQVVGRTNPMIEFGQRLMIWDLLNIHPGPGQGPFGGLALANSSATALESIALWVLLRRRVKGLNDTEVIVMGLRLVIVSLVMGAAVWVAATLLKDYRPIVILFVSTLVGVVTFEVVALILGLPEARSVPATVLRRFRR